MFVRVTSLRIGNLYDTFSKSIISAENLNVGATTWPLNVSVNISELPSKANLNVSENSPRMSDLKVTLIKSLTFWFTPKIPSVLLKWNFDPKGVS